MIILKILTYQHINIQLTFQTNHVISVLQQLNDFHDHLDEESHELHNRQKRFVVDEDVLFQ